MSDKPQNLDKPPAIDLEESRKIFSPETFQRLIELISPKLRAGKRSLVHIMPASSRFAHMALEPWALHAMYGEEFDEIIVVIRDHRLLPHGKATHALASTVVSFVETTNEFVVKLGHFDALRMENGPLTIQLRSAPELLKDLWRHVRAGNAPHYLRLPDALEEQAAEFFSRIGMAPDERSVTLHMREASYLSSHRYHGFRNMTPENYGPAIQHLLDQGIWVFRLGDKDSTPLVNDHPRFVDLPFRDDYEDYMDVVLLAKAWFAICCSTGPLGPAIALGTTVLLVNGILEQQTFFNPRDVIQFKRYIDDTTGLPIPYRDLLDRDIAGYSIASELEQNNVHLEENSREEILSAVQEMETRWGGTFDADPLLDAKFRAINEEFLARLEARHPETGGTEPSERNFGLAVPWTTVCQRFCQDNPWFL